MERPARKASESAEKLKAFIGQSSGTHVYRVTEAGLRAFCDAVGARYRDGAPPTYMTVFRHGEFELFDRMGILLKSVLHADQEFRYEQAIVPGDELEYVAVLAKAFEKNGAAGPMKFFIFETAVYARRSEGKVPIGTSKTTVIVRSGEP